MKYWDNRAKTYNNIDWAKDEEPIKKFIDEAMIDPDHSVLEIGFGTGNILNHIDAKHIVGVDISKGMCDAATKKLMDKKNMTLICGDFMDDFVEEGTVFDRILMRMVLHHQIMTMDALTRVKRLMNGSSRLIIGEGIPPNDQLLGWFTNMFSFKEDRICWSEGELEDLLEKADFIIIRKFTYETRASIKNWIKNSGIPKQNQDTIWEMHVELFKKKENREAYKVEEIDGDFIVSFKFVGFYCAKKV